MSRHNKHICQETKNQIIFLKPNTFVYGRDYMCKSKCGYIYFLFAFLKEMIEIYCYRYIFIFPASFHRNTCKILWNIVVFYESVPYALRKKLDLTKSEDMEVQALYSHFRRIAWLPCWVNRVAMLTAYNYFLMVA